MAANRGMTMTALFTELVRNEWARTEKTKLAPEGFIAEVGDDNRVIIGGEHMGTVSLTVAEARDFARSAALVLAAKRPVATVIESQAVNPAMLTINRQGCGYTLAVVRDSGKLSQGLGSTLVKDLISAIIDRAMSVSAS